MSGSADDNVPSHHALVFVSEARGEVDGVVHGGAIWTNVSVVVLSTTVILYDPPSSASDSSDSSDLMPFGPALPLRSPLINHLGLVVNVCYNITDRWLQSRDAAVLHLRHRVHHTKDLLARPPGSFDVGGMRYLFEDDFMQRSPSDLWFAHGLVPYTTPFEADVLGTLIDIYHLDEYETFFRQVDATNGPNVLKLFSMLWNPALATHFFNALNVPEHPFGATYFFEECTEMMRPRRWEECSNAINTKIRQLSAADHGTRNRLGRLGFPVKAYLSEPPESDYTDCGSDAETSFHSPAASVDSIDILLADVRYDELYCLARPIRDSATQTEEIATVQPVAPPGEDTTVYRVGNSGSVNNWSTAATAQHEGQRVVASTTRHKPKKGRNPDTSFVVVLVGKPPGVYPSRDAKPHYTRISGAIYQGFPDHPTALLAWDAAQAQGLVGTDDGRPPASPQFRPFNLASTRVPPPSAMSGSGRERRFYCVYRGIEPGLYDSA
ncbi:hypothetical protein CYLTODRAFT_415126 [Cylindrobasidium torrendii FP15055 ss-10]|uniref:Uncharacterized protein n=1 Tax=Cylindrobasidium torrendii FP15055 ss-10 TaxID=1314674 RepID=A0A0D7AU41_9AGAR|nr:hypothetical protein CYLTODRAFT_415126 [Cylindrobasidium torrendii FP15055 ss-10]